MLPIWDRGQGADAGEGRQAIGQLIKQFQIVINASKTSERQ